MNGPHRPCQAQWWTVDPTRRRLLVVASIAVLGIAVVIGALLHGSSRRPAALPPTPPSPGVTQSVGTAAASSPSSARTKARPPGPITCSRSAPSGGGTAPLQICIPSLRVDTAVMKLGLNPDRTVEVPPLSRVGDAGWYKYSAAPGDVGPTVILGHVDSAQYGDGVFFRLAALRAGDTVVLARGDGMIATFRVDAVREVAKKHFPTDDVYGATSGPALRLVTCGGRFNSSTGSYDDNIIAFGTLLTLRHR